MAKEPGRQTQALATAKFMQQVGKSGIVMVNGIISKEEYNRDLLGVKGLELYNRMRLSDGTVRAALMVVKLPILAANWDVEPANDSPEAMEAAAGCKYSLFTNNNFEDMLREVLTMFDFGFSAFEQVFETGNIRLENSSKAWVVLKDLLFMKQTSIYKWQIGEGDNAMPGITQRQLGGGNAEIPAIKTAVFTHDKEGDNYEGHSLLRAAYKHWYIKDTLYQIDAIAHEKQGLGILKVKVPKGAKEDDKTAARDIAEEQRANEEAYIEELEGFEFEFMDMKARTTRDIMPSIDHHDRMILQSVLAQFLSIGSASSSGSFSASDNQTDLFLMAEEASAKTAQAVFNNTVIRNLCELNGIAEENRPKLVYGRIGKDSIQAFTEALSKLFTSGAVTPDPDTENYIRRFLHLPELDQATIDEYDSIRAIRRNPAGAAPNPPAQVENTKGNDKNNDALTAAEAERLITAGRAMREALKVASHATTGN